MQVGFYERESEKDIGKIKFVLKGISADFLLEYDFKDELNDKGGFYQDD
jgi:hypothetical protein